METLICILAVYYMFVLIVGILASLAISLSGEVYEMECCLCNKADFIHCVFMYQYAIKYLLEDEINIAGIVILEVFTSLSVWFLNAIILIILLLLLMVKGICYVFWMMFRKRNADGKYKEDSNG